MTMMTFQAFLLCSILVGQAYSMTCIPGSYLPPYSNICYNCPKGMYQDKAGQTSCKWCNGGEYNIQQGRTKCDVCPIGHSCYYVDTAPVKCPKGQYQNRTGQRWCKWCNGGEYNIQPGQSKCDVCPIGHSCYYKNTAPVKCPKGEYQNQKGQTSCKSCNGGEYNIHEGRSKCNVCPIGHSCYYKNTAPVKCPRGQYQDQTGQRSCKGCKRGKYNIQTAATSCKRCPAGSKCPFVDSNPFPCFKGFYSPPESTKCFFCASGYFCPRPSMPPVPRSNDTFLRSKIHNVANYASQAYHLQGKGPQGFARYEAANKTIIVSFRGSTVSYQDWKNNLDTQKANYTSCQGCLVHTGFLNYYHKLQISMLLRVGDLSHTHPKSKVIVTGHSLGGALATFAAVDLAKRGYNTELITYGSPRVGNKKFSEYADKTLKSLNLRVTYKDDIVTVLPPQSKGYWHVGQEIHYTDQNSAFELPPKTDVGYYRNSAGDHKMVNYEKLN